MVVTARGEHHVSGGFDTVFVGGRVFTAGSTRSVPLAVGIAGGRIAAVGTDHDVLDGARAGARIENLRGGLLVPAFHDAHAHPVSAGVELLQCDVTGAGDARETLRAIGAYAAAHPSVPWIVGGGWTMGHFAGGTPTREALDDVVRDRPVALQNRDHHGTWVNSRALELAGITERTPDPPDGRIERDASGRPSGTLHEGAARLLDTVLPPVDLDLALAGLRAAESAMFEVGVIGWQDAWVGAMSGIPDILDVYLSAVHAGKLTARVTAALWWERERGLEQIDDLRRRRTTVAALDRADVLRADAVKIMLDGVAENFTAALSEPYLDGCGHATANAGMLFVEQEVLQDAVRRLDADGFGVHFHALGDRAVSRALDAIAAARRANGPTPHRHHLAHLQMVAPADLPRFAELGAAANLQMLWAAVDQQLDELTFPFLSDTLIERHYPFASLHAAGAPLVAGSDWPVSSPDPLAAIHVGVNRAEPGSSTDPRITPGEALDLATALTAYTAGSARINGRGEESGRIAPGMLADLVVLDRDPFDTPREDVHRARVRQTWIGGVSRYEADGTASL